MDDKLVLARKRIEKGKEAVALQKLLIADRQRQRLSTALQESLLADLEETLRSFEAAYQREVAASGPKGSR